MADLGTLNASVNVRNDGVRVSIRYSANVATSVSDALLVPWELTMTVLPGFIFLIAAAVVARGGRRPWKIDHMRKGAHAEARIGHVIEYSITRQACAVAHNVTDIVDSGDIDHLVATPGGLWVIETKSNRHSSFERRKLEALARKVNDVRNWAPPDTRVFGCLVYANDAGPQGNTTHEIYGESISNFSQPKIFVGHATARR